MDWPLDLTSIATLPTITTSFCCIKRCNKYNTEKPYFFSGPLPTDQEPHRTNLEYENAPNVLLRDLRGYEKCLNLDRHGFEFIDRGLLSTTQCKTEEDAHEYMLGISEYTKSRFGAELVVCYDYSVQFPSI